jgi:cbb3-type cytochrome oxidase subunit 1
MDCEINMDNNMEYLKKENNTKKLIRTELFFTPLLVFFPLIVGLLFVINWYINGFTKGKIGFESELLLGLIIIVVNLIFDIPFIKSLIKQLSK